MRGSGSARREGRAGHSRSPADAVPASLSARHRRLCSCAWDRAVASTSSVTPSHQSNPPIPLPLTSLSRPPPLPPRPLAPGAPPTARTDSPPTSPAPTVARTPQRGPGALHHTRRPLPAGTAPRPTRRYAVAQRCPPTRANEPLPSPASRASLLAPLFGWCVSSQMMSGSRAAHPHLEPSPEISRCRCASISSTHLHDIMRPTSRARPALRPQTPTSGYSTPACPAPVTCQAANIRGARQFVFPPSSATASPR